MVRATVALGGLSPDDVSVEVVYGRVGDADEILNPAVSPLTVEDGPDDGVARFVGKAELGRPGRSATRSGSCPGIPCWPAPRRWAWSRCRRRPPG